MSTTAPAGATEQALAMRQYLREDERRARALGNHGPIRFTADGSRHLDILDAYSRRSFYVFEGVLGREELADIDDDNLLDLSS